MAGLQKIIHILFHLSHLFHKDIALNIETPNGNKISLNDNSGETVITDENSNSVVMNAEGIEIKSCKNINFEAKKDISIKGININSKAQSNLKSEGGAGLEVSSSAMTVIKGSLIKLN